MKFNRSLYTFSICVLQYSAEQKTQTISCLNLLYKSHSLHQDEGLEWRHIFKCCTGTRATERLKSSGHTYTTGLGCRLTTPTTSSPFSGWLMLRVLGQGLDHGIQAQVFTDLGFGFTDCPGWTSAGCAPGPPPFLSLSRLGLTRRAHAPLSAHPRPPPSLRWGSPGGDPCNFPTACLLMQLTTATHSRSKSVWKKTIPPQFSIHPSQRGNVEK